MKIIPLFCNLVSKFKRGIGNRRDGNLLISSWTVALWEKKVKSGVEGGEIIGITPDIGPQLDALATQEPILLIVACACCRE